MSSKTKNTAAKEGGKPVLVPKLRFPEFRDAAGWDADDLGEVADFVNEKIPLERIQLTSYVSTENILADYGGVTRASKLPTTGSVTRYKPNDTLVSNIRPYLKKVWVADNEGGASNDVIVIRAKQELLPQYFSWLLKNDAFINYVMTGAKGVKMPRGDIGSMKEYPTLYPSKPEQRKIGSSEKFVPGLIRHRAAGRGTGPGRSGVWSSRSARPRLPALTGKPLQAGPGPGMGTHDHLRGLVLPCASGTSSPKGWAGRGVAARNILLG